MTKFNASMGEKHWLMINCMWYRSRFRCQAGLLHTFRPFCPKTSKLESAVFSQQKKFCLAHHFCWMHREKTISMKEDLFSQLAERSSRALPVYLFTDHPHYVTNQRSTVFEIRNKIMEVEGRIVSQYNILVIHKFIHFMLLFRHSLCFAFSF